MSEQPGEQGLVAAEGVDEGSAAATDEAARPAAGDGVLGAAPQGRPDSEQDPAAPLDAESATSRAARDEAGSGQQLAEGEG